MTDVTNDEVLNTLFANMPDDERAVMCSVSGDPSTVERWPGSPWRYGTRCGLNAERNNYVAISSFTKSPETGQYRRRKDQFAAVYAVMIDDIGTKLDVSRLPAGLVPTIIVETSPKNYQATFKLTTPLRDMHRADELMRSIVQRMTPDGIDPGMLGVTRVMRLPGGINGKPKYMRDGELWRCRVYRWFPDMTTSVEELLQAFGTDLADKKRFIEPSDAVTFERKRSFALVLKGLEMLGRVKRKGRWIDVVCPWVGEHTDRSETGSAVAYPEGANGYLGGYRCHHGHCAGRSWSELEGWVQDAIIQQGRDTRGPFTGTP